jgi:hypothetical protein
VTRNLQIELQSFLLILPTQRKNNIIEVFLKSITKEWINLFMFGKEVAELEEQLGKMKLTQEKVLKMLNN